MKYSLVIPCYNESASIPSLMERCKTLIDKMDGAAEVVLVNNGSSDNSEEVFESLLPDYPGCRVVNVSQNQGYGYGILQGLRSCNAEFIGWTHADLQTDPVDACKGFALVSQYPNSFVKGKRYGRPLADTFFTIGMSFFESILLKTRLWDINAQPTIFSKEFFDTWQDPPSDFSLDLYAYYIAKKNGQNVKRFPVRFGERAHGVSHWNVDWSSKKKFIKRTMDFSFELKKRF